MPEPTLHHGPAVQMLRAHVATASVDMVYSDPPFGNRQEWKGKAGSFTDNWSWDAAAERRWAALAEYSPVGADLIAAITPDLRDRSYLAMIAELLIEVRRVLKPTGSLWLHFDDTMGAHLRILGDVVFGLDNQLGTVIWKRSEGGRNTKRGFGRHHDTIACFTRTRAARWRLARCRGELVFGDPCGEVYVDGLLHDRLNATSKERVGYPTQKPVSLIEHFIRAGSLPADVVLDPTCGSGTTLVAATRLGRRGIGIDASADAIATTRERLLLPAPPAQGELFGMAA